jgi:hypothetical protein
MKYWSVLLLLFFTNIANAQVVRGYFLSDSLEIGKNVEFVLVCEHDNTKELVFPGKSSNYAPFTFSNLEYSASTVKNGTYRDSVKYQLKTFSVDSVIKLRLFVNEYKTNAKFYSNTATIILKSALKKKDFVSPRMKPIINFYEVPLDINYPKFVYLFLFIGLGLYLVWIFTGKFIIRNIRILLYKKKHRDFLANYKRLMQNTNVMDGSKKTLVLWKNHLQWLLHKPISTMTSKEITDELGNDRLGEALTYIDAAIFGGQQNHQIKFAIDKLIENANENYRKELSNYIQNLKKK